MIFARGVTPEQRAEAYVRQSNGHWQPEAGQRAESELLPADAPDAETRGETRIIPLSRFRFGPRLVQDTSDGSTTVFVRGPLDGFWGFDANRMAERLDEVEPTSILLDVATPGGYTEQAALVYGDMVRRRDAGVPINARASGIVASAGTTLFAVGAERSALPSANFMVHAPYFLAFHFVSRQGVKRFSAYVERLLGTEEARMEAMFRASGIAREQIRAWLDDDEDHWMTPREAFDAGLVTEEPPADSEEPPADSEEPEDNGEGEHPTAPGEASEAKNETQDNEPPAPLSVAVRTMRFGRMKAAIDASEEEEKE